MTLAKKPLTDRAIAHATAAPPGKRRLLWDAIVPGLALRVTDRGKRSFVLVTRYPGTRNPAPRSLGSVGAISLEQARDKARQWFKMIAAGVDPGIREIERREQTFDAIASGYLTRKAKDLRSRGKTEATLARLVYPTFGARPIDSITRGDVVDHVVPLSKAAQALVEGDGDGFIFTANGKQAIGSHSRHKAAIDAASGVAGWTLHDLRRSARSLMSRAGVPSDHAERCLGHVIGGVRGVYDRHAYREEKRQGFEALAGLVERIVDPQPNVVALRGPPHHPRKHGFTFTPNPAGGAAYVDWFWEVAQTDMAVERCAMNWPGAAEQATDLGLV
jgi:Arm DNA-binding domain